MLFEVRVNYFQTGYTILRGFLIFYSNNIYINKQTVADNRKRLVKYDVVVE